MYKGQGSEENGQLLGVKGLNGQKPTEKNIKELALNTNLSYKRTFKVTFSSCVI